jgi:hypothetical protein
VTDIREKPVYKLTIAERDLLDSQEQQWVANHLHHLRESGALAMFFANPLGTVYRSVYDTVGKSWKLDPICCCNRRVEMTKGWKDQKESTNLILGRLHLLVTDQTNGGTGWWWHVCITDEGFIEQRGGANTMEEAKAAAIEWTREFCLATLQALEPGPALPSQNGKTP